MEGSGLDFTLSESQKALQGVARAFAERELRPVVMQYDKSPEFPHPPARRMTELGCMGMTWPEELGGAGMSDADAVVVIEERARVDPSAALTAAPHNPSPPLFNPGVMQT
jgi:alkylation response protein AidB-like acyl-CoA dehydrogenase